MTDKKALEIGQALELLRKAVYDAAFENAGEIGVPDIYVPQALVMAAASIIIDINENFRKEIAISQWNNSVGGAIDTLKLNGVAVADYEKSSGCTQNIYIPTSAMGKPN